MSPPRAAALSAADDVGRLAGIGPARADALRRMGLATVADLLEHFPVRHERHEPRTIENLEPGMIATVIGQVRAARPVFGRRGRSFTVTLEDNTSRCRLCWFNAPWVADRLRPGMVIRATGRVAEFRDAPQLVNPRFEVLGDDAAPIDESAPPSFEPVYPATAQTPSRVIARIIARNLDAMLAGVAEWYPPAYLGERGLIGRRAALAAMHRPTTDADVARARRRLAYDELLCMQLAVSIGRHHRREGAAALACTPEIDERIRRRFPFTLTPAQQRAVETIVADLGRTRPMNRLLHGDVGCGKTVVALYAALVCVANRRQAALMAPTELLAEQHHRSIMSYLAGSRVRVGLLVGGLPAAERSALRRAIEAGEVDIVVGTHALIQHDVSFARLGLVVVDEQHRFGVRQRAVIRSKGPAPHYLVMTATPIPRTLAMTVFGDLDVTTIDGMPPGRSPVATRVVGPREHESAWRATRDRVRCGEQAFVIYPIIDESDRLAIRAATGEFDRLRTGVFEGVTVALLHGRMNRRERERVMADFAAGRAAVLVATTVVEVGIDVPNATCMVIEHADRYGLSQLHQLRGRIGRGAKGGSCFLLTDSDHGAHAQRLAVLASNTDGFRIAEEDLRLRGPGELLGTQQHGLPGLKVADLLGDADLLRIAQRDADELLRRDPHLRSDQFTILRRALAERYERTIAFLDAG